MSSEQLSRVAILTADRPQLLERTLTSLRKQACGPVREVLVSDDSHHSLTRSQNRRICTSISRDWDGTIYYIDRADRERWAESLADACSVEIDITKFALLGPPGLKNTFGANRNSCCLFFSGVPFVFADDDILYDFRIHPEFRDDALEVSEFGDPTKIEPFETRERAYHALKEVSVDDVWSIAELLLGTPVSEIPALGRYRFAVGGSSKKFQQDISAGRARIAAVMPGYVGDSGMGNAHYRLRPDALLSKRFISEGVYESVRLSRDVRRSSGILRVRAANSLLMMMCSFIDNRFILPPFFPFSRNSDGLFSQLMSILGSECIAYLPQMVLHDPPHRTDSQSSLTTWFEKTASYQIVHAALLLISRDPGVRRRPDLFRFIGSRLREISSSDSMRAQIKEVLLEERKNTMLLFRQMLQRNSETASQRWKADVELVIDAARRGMERPDILIPTDLKSLGEDGEIWNLLAQYGRLIEIWPQLRDADNLVLRPN